MPEPKSSPFSIALGYRKGSKKPRQDRPADLMSDASNCGTGELTMTRACAIPNNPTATGTNGMPLNIPGMPNVKRCSFELGSIPTVAKKNPNPIIIMAAGNCRR